MPFPNPLLIASPPLEYIFLNKDDGTLLSGGVVSFFSDPAFAVSKSVYEISNAPDGSIDFVDLGNVLILSSIGTFVDAGGSNLIPYYYPYEGNPTDASPGNPQLYYIKVESSGLVLQFTLSDWPPNAFDFTALPVQVTQTQNLVTNPQFVTVSFDTNPATTPYVYNVSGSNTLTELAPNWFLKTSGSGTVTVKQITLSAMVSDAPYAIQISGSSGVVAMALVQRIYNSPSLLAGSIAAGYFLAASPVGTESTVTMTLAPSDGMSSWTIASGTTTPDTLYKAITGSVLIGTPYNTNPATTGYVDIILTITPNTTVQLTSIQVLGVPSLADIPGFIQESTPQQINGLFSYFQPELNYKPIPSYLTGWDFALNPAQTGATVVASAIGANKSKYVWDQTIVFQSTDSGVGVTRASSGAIVLTAAAATQMALVQYLDQRQARDLLNGPVSVNVSAFASASTTACVSLWYTTGATLPVITAGTNNSIVATLDANGHPATTNTGPWVEVPRANFGNSIFTIGTSSTQNFNDYGFSGWDLLGSSAGITTATYFAIVVGTGTVPINGTVTVGSISLVPGYIPTRPAPQTYDEVLRECQYYYEQSYPFTVTPGTASSTNGELIYPMSSVNYTTNTGPVTYSWYSSGAPFTIPLKASKRLNTYTPVFYAPAAGTVANFTYTKYTPSASSSSVAVSNWAFIAGYDVVTATISSSFNLASATGITTATPSYSGSVALHYVVDARLGVI